MTNPSAVDLEGVIEGLEVARDALARAPHGDNCFLHDDGGEYDRCFCGKDSVVAHLDGLLNAEAAEQTDPLQIEEAREIVRRALHAADNGNHAGEQAVLRMVSSPGRLREAEGEWQPIETAPRPEEYQPMVYVLLSWTDVSQEGEVRQTVGEGYWRAEGAGGDWWWANLGPGDYHADPIAEMITGQITHWRPLPAPPVTPEGPALLGRGGEP